MAGTGALRTQDCIASFRSARPLCRRPCQPARPAQARAQIGSDRYSSIVVDAATGNVLEAANPDAPRHPASLAKLMTCTWRSRRCAIVASACQQLVPVSAAAAATAPTKLGLVPGHAADGGGGDPRPGHQVRQRRGGRARRTARRLGGPVCPDDDPARPCAGHEPHHLHQRLGPAGPGRMDHGPRPCDPGAPPADRTSPGSIRTSAPPASPSGVA